MKRLTTLLLITVLVGACEGPAASPDHPTIAESQALDIAEATFRYQFVHDGQTYPVYFLTLFDKDPSPEFLNRFKHHKPPVRPGSEFVMGKGVAFSVDRIKRVSKTKVEVFGGYFSAEMTRPATRTPSN